MSTQEQQKARAQELRKAARENPGSIAEVLDEALGFVSRHSEDWYYSGQELCGKLEGAIAGCPGWIPVGERLPEERERPYQVIVVCGKQHGDDSMYPGRGVRRFQQDWVVRRWPQNFTHWMEAMPWPEA